MSRAEPWQNELPPCVPRRGSRVAFGDRVLVLALEGVADASEVRYKIPGAVGDPCVI